MSSTASGTGNRQGAGQAMANEMVRRRVGGPTLNLLVDLFGQARTTRNWLVLILVVVAIAAAVTAFVGQTVLPWAIYPAL